VQKSPGIFESLGGIAGGVLGGPAGAMLGSKAGDLLAKITGFGDYEVNQNTLVGGNPVPSFKMASDGVIIAHREFITDITGATNFTNLSLPINPGLATTFPWLAPVAANFEEYEMLGLVFEYRPSSGSAVSATSAALGVVVYATDYNVLAPNFATKQQMESYEFSNSTVPFQGMLHAVECAPQSNVLSTQYVRSGSIPTGADQRMYDLGNFQYAVSGMQSSYVVGELWASYHIKLKKPRIGSGLGFWSHITEGAAASGTAAAPLGTTGGVISSSSVLLGVSIGAVKTTQFVLQIPGQYLINMVVVSGNSNITSAPTLALGSNITSTLLILVDNTVGSASNFTSTHAFFSGIVNVVSGGNGAANTLTIGGLATMSGGIMDLMISPIPFSPN